MEKKDLFRIGEMSKLFHLSVGSLRHYEKIGLIKPYFIDPDTNYRYYHVSQFESLNTIRYLRILGMGLDKIGEFLNDRSIESIKTMLSEQKDEISQKIDELYLIERKINNRLNQLESAEKSKPGLIKIKNIPSKKIAWIKNFSTIRNNKDIEFSIRELEKNQKNALVFLGKVGLGISKENLIKENFDTYDRVFLILDKEDKYQGNVYKLKEHECVIIRYRGRHEEAKDQYKKLMKFIKDNKLIINGFSQEITLIDSGYTNDKTKFITEIQIPIKRAN